MNVCLCACVLVCVHVEKISLQVLKPDNVLFVARKASWENL